MPQDLIKIDPLTEYRNSLERYLQKSNLNSRPVYGSEITMQPPEQGQFGGIGDLIQNQVAKKAVKKLFDSGIGSSATEATQAAWNSPGLSAASTLQSTPFSQMGWNAGALGGDSATIGLGGVGSSAPEAMSISNFAGGATPYLGAAGTALGAYQALQGFKKKDPLAAALGGGGAALGLNMMGLGLGPLGWGAAIGIPAIAAFANKMGDKDRFKEEYKRAQKLRDAGINWGFNTVEPTAGKGRNIQLQELLAGGADPNSREAKWMKTGDEQYLGGKDVVGYSFLPEKFGKEFADASLDKRIGAAQLALDSGAVREHHGQMDFNQNFTPELEAKIKEFLSAKA